MKTYIIGAVLACLSVIVMVVPADSQSPANVAGAWTIDLTFLEGESTHTAVIEQDGEDLSGTYKGQYLEGPLRGTVSGNEVRFSGRIRHESTGVSFNYTGTVDGNTMSGTVSMGEYWTADFTAKKK